MRMVALCWLMTVLSVAVAAAESASLDSIDSSLDLWIVDTRCARLSELADGGEPSLAFKRWQRAAWIDSDREAFLTSQQPDVPTVFLIHGNWTNISDVLGYGRLCERLFGGSETPHRLVLWTWSSERVCVRPRVDVRVKAARADVQSKHFVRFLRELKSESCVTLAGFSFGARIASMSLEEIATLGNDNALRLRAILMAAAVDTDWLLPNRRLSHAVDVAERIDILYNPRDDKLKYYPKLDCLLAKGPTALGTTGLSATRFRAEDQPKVRSINVVRWIGADHSFLSSLRAMLNYGGFKPVGLFDE